MDTKRKKEAELVRTFILINIEALKNSNQKELAAIKRICNQTGGNTSELDKLNLVKEYKNMWDKLLLAHRLVKKMDDVDWLAERKTKPIDDIIRELFSMVG